MSNKTLNLGIFAHVDAGKTTLAERLLFDNGTTHEFGSVDAGTTQTDSSELERERGITIRLAVASFNTGSLQVNLVDTPGHPDFIAEVDRALSVLDGAVLVLSAAEGIQSQTRTLMRSLRRLRKPTLIFINKVDRLETGTRDLLDDIQHKLAPHIVPLSSVRRAGNQNMQVFRSALDSQCQLRDIAEVLAENDEGVLEQLVEGSVPSREEVHELLVRQTGAAQIHPVFFGSALTGEGVSELTDGIRTLLPTGDGDTSGEPRGIVFAIDRTGGKGKVAYLRLFSGSLRERQRVTFWRRDSRGTVSELTGRIARLEVVGEQIADIGWQGEANRPLNGNLRASELSAGNIGRLRGFPQVRIGDLLGEWNISPFMYNFVPPSLATIVRARQPGQEVPLHAALVSLADEDPLIQTRAIGSGATSLLLYGEIQKEVIEARLKREFGVEPVFGEVQPVYLERPVGVGESVSELDPRAQNEMFWAAVGLRIEPNEVGGGIIFKREVKLGTMPQAFHRAIEDTVFDSLQQGLYGWPVKDCLVTLIHVGCSAVTSTAADFRNLTPLVLMRAMKIAATQVYEPCHSLEIEVPPDVIGNVVSHLTVLGANVTQSVSKGAWGRVEAEVPVRLVQEFSLALPRLSRGEGMVWSHPGPDRPIRRSIPIQARFDGNPLNYDEYMRFLALRKRGEIR